METNIERASKILAVNRRADGITGCIRFDKGSAGFSPPHAFVEALQNIARREARQHLGYVAPQGLPELRAHVARLEGALEGVPVSSPQVLITAGALEGIDLALSVLCKKGDEAIANEVSFEGFHTLIAFHGMRARPCDLSDVRSVARVISQKTRILFINSPENPGGKVYSKEELSGLARLVRRHNLWIIADDVNNQIIYHGEKWQGIRRIIPHRTIVVSSFSKNYFLQGLRVGWMVAPQKVIKQSVAILATRSVCVSRVGQFIGAETLRRLPHRRLPLHYLRVLERRRNCMAKSLHKEGFCPLMPQGGTNFFLETGVPSERLSAHLFKKYRVAVIPGIYFGAKGDTFIRIGFGSVHEREIVRGCAAIGKATKELTGGIHNKKKERG